jgi:excinuclease UvrABC nuclease subunit
MTDQQRLFDHYNPIEERMGSDFFEQLPSVPGIYKMYGSQQQLLYVGKAKNLRNRLFTYRRAKMGKTRRKTVRLIRMTHHIETVTTGDEKEALLLENKLIREHQPEFNYAKKQPETYYFVGLDQQEAGLSFSLQMHQPDTTYVYGAFKGHRVIRKSLGGLIRVMYMLEHKVSSPFDLPSVLTRKLTPLKYELQLREDNSFVKPLWQPINDYFRGQNMDLLGQLMDECQTRDLLQTFAGSMILDDMESMKWFYERCSYRNFQIMQQLGLEDALIPQEKLDDYLIEWAFAEEE